MGDQMSRKKNHQYKASFLILTVFLLIHLPSALSIGVLTLPSASLESTQSRQAEVSSVSSYSSGSTHSSFNVQTTLLTSANREHPTMHGGWGPHLRGLMRAPDNKLWFVVDKATSVYNNYGLDYYSYDGSAWTLVGSQSQLPGVQQNVASIMQSNGTILSYGISITTGQIEECHFNTQYPHNKACNPILISNSIYRTPSNSNYIGAAIAPDGTTRIVWWTTVGSNGGAGDLSYIYNFGGGWNGPITNHLSGYNDLAYVSGALYDSTHFIGAGQLYSGPYPTGSYQGAMATITLGNLHSLSLLWPNSTNYAQGMRIHGWTDVYIDPASKSIHIVAKTSTGTVAYFHSPSPTIPTEGLTAQQILPDLNFARFVANGDQLSLIGLSKSSSPTISVLTVPINSARNSIIWSSPEVIRTNISLSNHPLSFYIEGRQYQSTAPVGTNFASVGSFPNNDHLIDHHSLSFQAVQTTTQTPIQTTLTIQTSTQPTTSVQTTASSAETTSVTTAASTTTQTTTQTQTQVATNVQTTVSSSGTESATTTPAVSTTQPVQTSSTTTQTTIQTTPVVQTVQPTSTTSAQTLLPSLNFQTTLLTSTNRNYQTMHGGWGPHLRGLMRAPDNKLWFVVDRGTSVDSNENLDYYSYDGSAWTLVGSQSQLPGVQQNVASIMQSDGMILSYGISIIDGYIEECFFHTTNPSYKACNAIKIHGNELPYRVSSSSNNIGAAVFSNGVKRIIWWSTVGGDGVSGSFTYTHNSGQGWNLPVTYHLSGYTDFAYVSGQFYNLTNFIGVGQLYLSTPSPGSYQGGIVTFRLGQPHYLSLLWPNSTNYAQGMRIHGWTDMHIDPASKSIHALAITSTGKVAYFYSPNFESAINGLTAKQILPEYSIARFVENSGKLSLVARSASSSSTISVLTAPVGQASGAIDWSSSQVTKTNIAIESFPPSIYIEGRQYQSTAPVGINFAVPGSFPDNDHKIHHYRSS